jgi:hypothetical protein
MEQLKPSLKITHFKVRVPMSSGQVVTSVSQRGDSLEVALGAPQLEFMERIAQQNFNLLLLELGALHRILRCD